VNVDAPMKDKTDYKKDSFYKELQHIFQRTASTKNYSIYFINSLSTA
jgi:hypothetical protein